VHSTWPVGHQPEASARDDPSLTLRVGVAPVGSGGPQVGETLWQRLVRGVRRLRQRPYWAHFAGPGWAEHFMAVVVTDRFHAKQGRSIGRWVLQREDQRLVVYLKRHYRLPWWRGLLATLLPNRPWSPALQEWDHLEWARAEGLPVPVAAAA